MFYLRSPICFNNFRYGKAQFPTVNETFVFVAVGVNDLEGTEVGKAIAASSESIKGFIRDTQTRKLMLQVCDYFSQCLQKVTSHT